MSNETRRCNACGLMLSADATACSGCGTKQHLESDALSPFALIDDDELDIISPAVAEAPPAAPVDEVPTHAADAVEEIEVEADEDEIQLVDVSEEPGAAAEPAAPAAPAEESAQTGETVRMSMQEVVQAWNEEATPEGAPPLPTTPLGEASGLPKGFWPVIVAIVLILGSLALLLT